MNFWAFFLLNKAKSLLGTKSTLLFFNSFNEDDFPLSTFLFHVFPSNLTGVRVVMRHSTVGIMIRDGDQIVAALKYGFYLVLMSGIILFIYSRKLQMVFWCNYGNAMYKNNVFKFFCRSLHLKFLSRIKDLKIFSEIIIFHFSGFSFLRQIPFKLNGNFLSMNGWTFFINNKSFQQKYENKVIFCHFYR